MKNLFLVTSFVFSSIVWAAPDFVGNGGDAVVCRNSGEVIVSAELLDFYEGTVLRGLTPDLDESKTVEQNLDTLMNRLLQSDQVYWSDLQANRESFFSEAVFLSGIELEDIVDSNHQIVPKGCKVEQLVIQSEPRHPGDPRYIFSKDIWDHMSSSDKAGTIFHELLLRDLLRNKKEDVHTIDVRYFNSVVAADQFAQQLPLPVYIALVEEKLHRQFFWYDGAKTKASSLRFGGNGEVKSYRQVIENEQMEIFPGETISFEQAFIENSFNGDGQHIKRYSFIGAEDKVMTLPGTATQIRTPKSYFQFIDGELDMNFKNIEVVYTNPHYQLVNEGIQCHSLQVLAESVNCTVDSKRKRVDPQHRARLIPNDTVKKSSGYIYTSIRWELSGALIDATTTVATRPSVTYYQQHLEFYPSGALKRFSAPYSGCSASQLNFFTQSSFGQQWAPRCIIYSDPGHEYGSERREVIEFDPNGKVQVGGIFRMSIPKTKLGTTGFGIRFLPNFEDLLSAEVTFVNQGNGVPEKGISMEDAIAEMSDGSLVEIEQGDIVRFDSNGRIAAVE